MRYMKTLAAGALAALCLTTPATAQEPDFSAFETGPVFAEFGAHAPVEGRESMPAELRFAIAFDVADKAADGTRNRQIESAARFINMHVAAGVPQENIRIAVVVHGKATMDLMADAARAEREMEPNASVGLIQALLDQGVRVILCGQSGSVYGVGKADLIEGVELDLSAMTAHALLQQQGYTVNPF